MNYLSLYLSKIYMYIILWDKFIAKYPLIETQRVQFLPWVNQRDNKESE